MTDRTVRYRLVADINSFKTEMAIASATVKQAANEMTGASKEAVRFRAGLTTVGDTAGRVGLVAAAGIGMIVKSAMDWETAWTGVLKTVDGTPAQLAALETGLRSLAVETGFAHDEVAAVAEAAGQLGISTGGVEDFTRTMLDMGVSTSMSSEEAATGLARLRNIMGSTESEIRNTGSAMVELGNNFATTEGEILAMSQRIAGAGRQAGLSTADVLGLSTAMSSVGIEAEAGGTAMSLTMKRIGKEVETSGDNLALFARVSGMTASEFAQAWGEDAAGTLTEFVTGLGQAEAIGMSTNEVLRELGVTGIREADALLRLSGNAEGLAGALETANAGFRENNALAEEAGKFYGTSAQQVKQAWAQIKDSAIDAGAALLPVVVGAADAVGGLASAFQSLPGPVKSATGPLLGLTAIFGGGLWFTAKTVNGIASMGQALSDLGPAGAKAATGLGRVGRAAGVATAAIAGLAIIDSIQSRVSDLTPGIQELTGELIGLADAADYQSWAGLSDQMDGLANSIDRLADPNKAQALQDRMSDALGGIGGGTELKNARADIEALDSALAGLVAGGNADKAATALERLRVTEDLSKSQMDDLVGLMPQYAEALASVDNSARLAEGGMNDATGAADGLGDAFGDAEAAAEAFQSALEGINAVLSGRAALRDYEAAIDSFSAALKENGNTFDINTEKGRANQAALDGIASSALDVAEGLSEADRQEFLQGAIRNLREMGERFGVPKAETRALIALLREAKNTSVDPDIDADTGKASGKVDALQEKLDRYGLTVATGEAALDDVASGKIKSVQGLIDKYGMTKAQAKALLDDNASGMIDALRTRLASLDGRVATVKVVTEQVTNVIRRHLPFGGSADGSTVPKDGGPYADRYPYLLAPGEEVISNRFGQADRHRPLLKAINAGHLADGGTVGHLANGGTARSIGDRIDILRLRQEIRGLARSLNASGRDRLQGLNRDIAQLELKAAKQRLKAAQDQSAFTSEQRKALRSSVQSNVMSADLFGGGDLASFDREIRNQATEARSFAQAMKQLVAKGLDGPLLEEVATRGSATFAQQLLGTGRRGIREYEQLYAQANRSAQRASTHVAQAMGGDSKSSKRIESRLASIERAVARQGREFAAALDGKTVKAGRKARAAGGGRRS